MKAVEKLHTVNYSVQLFVLCRVAGWGGAEVEAGGGRWRTEMVCRLCMDECDGLRADRYRGTMGLTRMSNGNRSIMQHSEPEGSGTATGP